MPRARPDALLDALSCLDHGSCNGAPAELRARHIDCASRNVCNRFVIVAATAHVAQCSLLVWNPTQRWLRPERTRKATNGSVERAASTRWANSSGVFMRSNITRTMTFPRQRLRRLHLHQGQI